MLFFKSGPKKSRRMLARPRLEPLEDRVVPAFFGPVSYVADAREVVVADFNSDNLQDLAVTLPGWVPGSVGVLLGNGDGTFDPVIRSTAGYSPRALTVGDFNGDGDLDVVVAHQGTYDLSVLLGNGDGSFSALSAISIGSEATAMAVGDFNVDGKLDLGVGSNIFIPEEYDPETGQWLGHYEGFATVLLGRGDGSFGAPASTALGQVGYHVRASVGDYNGDGHLDLAAAYTVLLGDGAGNFPDMMGGYPTGDFPPYSVSGDFNRDDIVDIAWANRSSNTVGVARGVGNGVSYAAENFPTGALPIWLATGDFNRDGWLDVVTTGDFSGDVSVLLNDRTWPPPPQPSVSIYFGAAVGEGNVGAKTATFNVSLAGAYYLPISVHYATADGSATAAGGDYQPVTDAVLTFAPGETNKTITVLVNGDRIAEGYLTQAGAYIETFFVRLSNPTNTYFARPEAASGYCNIIDDEPNLQISGFAGPEGNDGITPFTFNVTLSAEYDAAVTVDYATADSQGATAGVDYTPVSGTLTFAPGQTTQAITVLVNGDRGGEADEIFVVNLSNATGARIYYGVGHGTIRNDDPLLRVLDRTQYNYFGSMVTEGHSGTQTATFGVTLSPVSSETVTVDFSTADGTGMAGIDYQAVSGTLTFAPGEAGKIVSVLVNGDRVAEWDETFFLNLSAATNATIADGQGEGIIKEDDPRVTINDVSRLEGKKGRPTLFVFTVTLSVAYDQPVTMSFQTVNGTATAASGDYIARTGTLTFNPGETTKTITIEVKGDNNKEANETFFLDLFGLSGNAQFTKSRGLGTILNDD